MADVETGATLSVVFVSYNSAEIIDRAIAAVRAHLPDAEVIVVDNASTDATRDIVARASTGVTLIQGHGNVGFGTGANIGFAAATGSLVLLLNPDSIVTAVDRRVLADLAARSGNQSVGLLGCRMSARPHEHGTYLISRLPSSRRRLWRYFLRGYLTPREISWPQMRALPRRGPMWVSGAALLARREDLLRVGGFDERFFLYGEDRDLSRRCGQRGIPVGTTTAVTVDHAGGASSSGVSDVKHLTWGLLSILQFEAYSNDPVSLTRVALRILAGIGALTRALRRIPLVGRRMEKRAETVRAVQASLVGFSNGAGPDASFYPDAVKAIEAARSTRG
ncbi:MAG: glycosyltransferase family 2 protein [Patulibacter sp.]|nr:glycosyltransferase family 2 protein [Patulibacter sp.]